MKQRSRVFRIHEHGGPEVLKLEFCEPSEPRPGELSISIKAIGLNRSEIMFRNGRHIEQAEFPARLGYEASGTIKSIGGGVRGFRIGDAVSLIPPPSVTRWGTYADHITVPAEFVVKNPANLSWAEAASVWMANITAFGGLVDIAGLKKGETALVFAASSSVGLASLQIAKSIGAAVIATTRTSEKKDSLIEAGADHVILTEEEDTADRVMEITKGHGVRVVFDPIAGPHLALIAEAMAPQGILIAYGALDGRATPMPLFTMIREGLSIRGFTFKEIVLDPKRRKHAVAFVLSGLTNKTLHPRIAKTFAFEDMANAHRYLESNEQLGKVVVELQ